MRPMTWRDDHSVLSAQLFSTSLGFVENTSHTSHNLHKKTPVTAGASVVRGARCQVKILVSQCLDPVGYDLCGPRVTVDRAVHESHQ